MPGQSTAVSMEATLPRTPTSLAVTAASGIQMAATWPWPGQLLSLMTPPHLDSDSYLEEVQL